MNLLQDALYWLTSGLMIPCIAFLLFMLVQSLMLAGRQFVLGRAQTPALNELSQLLRADAENRDGYSDEGIDFPPKCLQLNCFNAVEQIIGLKDATYGSYLITEFETQSDKLLSRFSNLAKLGPIAGLMGTLIPMGPALQGLAQGNIEQMASQMQIAFTTTVIGLIIGAIGFLLYQINKRQVIKELALLDYLLDVKAANT